MEEIAQRLHRVVHPAQQHRLAAERDAAVGEPVAGFRHLGRQLAGVAEVDRQPDAVLAQHGDQLRRDALRQEPRDAGADAQELDVRDRPQPAEELVERGVRHQQRVAAGEQDVAHLRVLLQVGEGRLDAPAERLELALADQAAPRAVAAVGRAGIERQEQHAVGVTVDEAFDHRGMVLAAAGRSRSEGLTISSESTGTTWRRIGHFGSTGSICAANCGVTATENFSLASRRPRRSSSVRRSSFSNWSRRVRRWRICQRQSFQWAGS